MYSTFPREVATPIRTLVTNRTDFLDFVNKFNGKTNLYSSIYSFQNIFSNKPIYDSCIVDRIMFDLDSSTCYADAMKLHNKFLEQNIRHTVIFSGRGFQVFPFTKKVTGSKSKELITNAQLYYIQLLGIDADMHVVGDLARISRIPNTFNMRRGRYCIMLNSKILNTSYEKIQEFAKTQYFNNHVVFGEKLLDLETVPKVKIPEQSNHAVEIYDDLNDPLLKYVMSHKISISGFRNNVIFKNLAVLLVNCALSDSEINEYAKIIAKNCEHRPQEIMGWVSKVRQGKITSFNIAEINKMILKYKLPVELYDVYDDNVPVGSV